MLNLLQFTKIYRIKNEAEDILDNIRCIFIFPKFKNFIPLK